MFASIKKRQQITLDLIRHGEPEGGVRYRGSIDDPLSATGWQQMRNAIRQAQTSGCNWDAVVTSPMQRCQQFAEEVSEQLSIPLSTEHELRELCFGELEGLTPEQAWQREPELLTRLWQDPINHTPVGGELYADFRQRISASMNRILAQPPGQEILLVVHGGVIRAVLSHFLHFSPQDSFRIDVPYAGMTRIVVYLEPEHDHNAALKFINRFTGTT